MKSNEWFCLHRLVVRPEKRNTTYLEFERGHNGLRIVSRVRNKSGLRARYNAKCIDLGKVLQFSNSYFSNKNRYHLPATPPEKHKKQQCEKNLFFDSLEKPDASKAHRASKQSVVVVQIVKSLLANIHKTVVHLRMSGNANRGVHKTDGLSRFCGFYECVS